MKALYIKPETKTYGINTEHQLLAGSDMAVGEKYSSCNEVLSPRGGLWDDDDFDDED